MAMNRPQGKHLATLMNLWKWTLTDEFLIQIRTSKLRAVLHGVGQPIN